MWAFRDPKETKELNYPGNLGAINPLGWLIYRRINLITSQSSFAIEWAKTSWRDQRGGSKKQYFLSHNVEQSGVLLLKNLKQHNSYSIHILNSTCIMDIVPVRDDEVLRNSFS